MFLTHKMALLKSKQKNLIFLLLLVPCPTSSPCCKLPACGTERIPHDIGLRGRKNVAKWYLLEHAHEEDLSNATVLLALPRATAGDRGEVWVREGLHTGIVDLASIVSQRSTGRQNSPSNHPAVRESRRPWSSAIRHLSPLYAASCLGNAL